MTRAEDGDKLCCRDCFADPAIRAFIESQGTTGECEFCGSRDVPVAALWDMSPFVDEGISRKYEDAAQQVPYESAEGGYQFDTNDLEQILIDYEAIFSPFGGGSELPQTLVRMSRFDTTPLIVQHPLSSYGDYLEYWTTFCAMVKHDRRFTLFEDLERQRNIHFDAMCRGDVAQLDDIGQVELWEVFDGALSQCRSVINPGTVIYRARRAMEGYERWGNKALTSAPINITTETRMSPRGISHFYGCQDEQTCLAEVRPAIGENVVVGQFRVQVPLNVIDLVSPRERISMFDAENFDFRSEIYVKPFLLHFGREIAQPIMPHHAPLEYLPTQSLCDHPYTPLG
ncbi:RES domain-containing protein [bacterium]|nr:RES domain-containing protein [bacterium]